MEYCKECFTPSTRPRIQFSEGICNACWHAKNRKNNKINYVERKNEFLNLIKRMEAIREENENPYHCIVPWSGGKDSSAIALKLKNEYNLNPLLVTFNPLIPTQIGIKNRESLLEKGFDSIYLHSNKLISKKLSLRFLIERGNPKLHWNAGITSSLYRAAINFRIPFIFYAEHGETNYGGKVLSKESEKKRDYEEVIENVIGDDPHNWESSDINLNEISPYLMPSQEELDEFSIEGYYFGYYFPWDIKDNIKYILKNIDFKLHPQGRTVGTFTDFDSLDDYIDDVYYYLQYIKYGFGRAIRDASRHIQLGYLSKKDALEKILKYDGEYPRDSIEKSLRYWNINLEKFNNIVDNHRSSLIWEKTKNCWEHKYLNDLRQKNIYL